MKYIVSTSLNMQCEQRNSVGNTPLDNVPRSHLTCIFSPGSEAGTQHEVRDAPAVEGAALLVADDRYVHLLQGGAHWSICNTEA